VSTVVGTIRITLPDGSQRELNRGATGRHARRWPFG